MTREAHDVVRQIAEYAEAIAFQAGVGSSETAGQIVSFLRERPSLMPAFMAGTLSTIDTGMLEPHNGVLSWHGQDGDIHRPDPVAGDAASFAGNLVAVARSDADAVLRHLAARPVEEPGEVERLTRENVNLQTSLNSSVQGHCKTLERAETAEAALAETREELACTLEELIDHTGDDMLDSRQKRVNELRAAGPLPKTEADPARLTEALHDLLTRPTDPAARQRARAALSTQESSAALAGDGKEAGR